MLKSVKVWILHYCFVVCAREASFLLRKDRESGRRTGAAALLLIELIELAVLEALKLSIHCEHYLIVHVPDTSHLLITFEQLALLKDVVCMLKRIANLNCL